MGRGEGGTGIILVLARQNIAVHPLRNWRYAGVYAVALVDLAAQSVCMCVHNIHACERIHNVCPRIIGMSFSRRLFDLTDISMTLMINMRN